MSEDRLDVFSPSSEIRLFRTAFGNHVFVADGSRIYDIDAGTAERLGDCLLSSEGGAHTRDVCQALGFLSPSAPRISATDDIELPPINALSLNLAQTCNMSCGYCYADDGKFGGRPRLMPASVARASVDRLLASCAPGERAVLGFMGGEPLLARGLLHDLVRYASERASQIGIRMGYSITTNGTLIREEDARLWRDHPFTVTISADGTASRHRAARRMNDGSDSYTAMLRGLETVQQVGRPRQLSARATVVPGQGALLPLLDHLLELGFDDAGFSPVLVSPDPHLAFSEQDFEVFLASMIECGEAAVAAIKAGRDYPFANLEAALQEIHRGTHRPFPCGAGAAYLSVDAKGDLFACHRLIGDSQFAMGSVEAGANDEARRRHLQRSHVDRIEPCRTCWARYLCGGGCHHEVKARGRIACDYIRGWLEFCLRAYIELSSAAAFAADTPNTCSARSHTGI